MPELIDCGQPGVRILLVEDDPMLGEAMRLGIQQEHHAVDWVHDLRSARTALSDPAYDALVLDLGLPDGDGTALIRDLRRAGSGLSIIVVSARDQVSDRVACLRLGADDFLVKPFDLDELAARIDASARRQVGRTTATVSIGDLDIDTAQRSVALAGVPVALSAREYALLLTLVDRRGQVLTRAELEQTLYGWGAEVESNAIEVHIHHLRRKLGAERIVTVRGHGYRYVGPG